MPADDPAPVSALEVAVWEANARALGVSVDSLMENAGRAVAEEAARHLPPPPARVTIIAGIGNNGGDGSCAAYYLAQWGHAPELWLVRPPTDIRGPAARRCFDRVRKLVPTQVGLPGPADLRTALLVDAMLGTGQSGSMRSPYREVAESMNQSGVPILSIDLPSGLGSPGAVRPRWTVALGAAKEGTTPENAGELVVRDIGIPLEARTTTGPGEFLLYPVRGDRDHRGRRHRVVVIGGGPYSGAPTLTGLAALRSGVERVTVAAPAGSAETVAGFSPDLVVRPIGRGEFAPADVPALLALVDELHPDAVIVGMGAGGSPPTVEALAHVIEALRGHRPLLVDADGLRGLRPRPGDRSPLIATPNAGEYARVFADDRPETPPTKSVIDEVEGRAREWGLTLLVKGAADLASDGHRTYRNPHHHAAATVGGVGDVLGGVVGGLLAQGLGPLDAARLGSFWVGRAGIRAAEQGGYAILATDVLRELPATLVDGLRRVRPDP